MGLKNIKAIFKLFSIFEENVWTVGTRSRVADNSCGISSICVGKDGRLQLKDRGQTFLELYVRFLKYNGNVFSFSHNTWKIYKFQHDNK